MIKKAIFITVRTGSTRLPQKALIKINGLTTIEYLIERAKQSREKDGIVLCTTKEKEDDILEEIARNHEVGCFRGSTRDKLERWRGAAEKFGVEFVVTVDGDDLFCEPELIDMAFKQHTKTNADFIEAKGLACGAFTYGIKTSALSKVCEIKNTDDTEIMWIYFKDTGLFNCEDLQEVADVYKRPEIRMTLDYPDDLKFFEAVINHFGRSGRYYNLKDIITYLDENPQVIKINQHLMEEFLNNQKKHMTLKVKKAYDKRKTTK